MSGEEMLRQIEKREYYKERERKNAEIVACMAYALIWLVIVLSVASIADHVKEFWTAFEAGF